MSLIQGSLDRATCHIHRVMNTALMAKSGIIDPAKAQALIRSDIEFALSELETAKVLAQAEYDAHEKSMSEAAPILEPVISAILGGPNVSKQFRDSVISAANIKPEPFPRNPNAK